MGGFKVAVVQCVAGLAAIGAGKGWKCGRGDQPHQGLFDTGCDLMYAISAVVGIIGAIKVFNKWNAGEPDTNKVAAAWFGSCIFLVVVATVLKSFFGT